MADTSSELTSGRLPSAIEQARNLVRQGISSANTLLTDGKFIASIDNQNSRWSVCAACEHLIKRHKCSKCGCIMPFKVKLEAAKCPIDKW